MLNFLSNSFSAIGGGNDGLFDLAAAEELIEAWRDEPSYSANQQTTEPETQPAPDVSIHLPPGTVVSLEVSGRLSPEEEQTILDLNSKLIGVISEPGGQEIIANDNSLVDVSDELKDLACSETHLAAPGTPESSVHAEINSREPDPVPQADYYALYTNEAGNLDHVFGHMAAGSPKETAPDGTGPLIDLEPLAYNPTSQGSASVLLAGLLNDKLAPEQSSVISPFKSLKDLVQEPNLDGEGDVLFFDDPRSTDVFYDAPSEMFGMVTTNQDSAPVTDSSSKQMSQENVPAEVLSLNVPVSKTSGSSKKKKVNRERALCRKCGAAGHFQRDCPTKGTTQNRKTSLGELGVSQEKSAEEANTISLDLPSSLALLSERPQSATSWLSRLLGGSTLTTGDGGIDLWTTFSLLGPSELTGPCPVQDLQPKGEPSTFGPSALIADHDYENNVFGLFGPVCLTRDPVDNAVQEEDVNEDGQTASVFSQDSLLDVKDDLLDFFGPSALTKEQGESSNFAILGPDFLTGEDTIIDIPNGSLLPPLVVPGIEKDAKCDQAGTLVSSTPESSRGLLGAISSRFPFLAGTLNARNTLLRLHPTDAIPQTPAIPQTQQATSQPQIQNEPWHNRSKKSKQSKAPPKEHQQEPKESGTMMLEAFKESVKAVAVNIPAQLIPIRRQKANQPPVPYETHIRSSLEAWLYASMVYNSPSGALANEFGPHHLVMWTDATAPDEKGKRIQALSVTYRQPHVHLPAVSEKDQDGAGWRDFAFTANLDSDVVGRGIADALETMAVEVAVGIAVAEVNKSHEGPNRIPIRRVTVLTDSQHSLIGLSTRKGGRTRSIEAYAEKLRERGVQVELGWVPGHSGVDGNERADRLALLASRFGPAPDRKGGMVRVPVPLLRYSESQAVIWEGLAKKDALQPYQEIQRQNLKQVLWKTAVEEGWTTQAG